jgi:glycine cleavage system H protein
MAETFPEDLRYSRSDEWVRREGDEAQCGVTAFAAEQLGDVVYVQLPDVGRALETDEAFGEIESVKAVSDLISPVGGVVTAVNEDLDSNPGLVNEDPYGAGWLIRLKLSDAADLDALLDATAYRQKTEASS